MSSIIEEHVSDVHRREKRLRMQSAAAIAHKEAWDRMGDTGKNAVSQPDLKFETDSAHYENNSVFLKGNPLVDVPQIICPHCKLPRLHYPIAGLDGKIPTKEELEERKFCNKHPWVVLAGHDCHGAPFPVMTANKPKDIPKNSTSWYLAKLGRPQKSQHYFPYVSCPWCKEENPQSNKSVVAFGFAKHADSRSCVRIRGNRNAKVNDANAPGTTASNTPSASRISTPGPGSQKEGGSEDTKKENGDDDTPKKAKKKSSYVKKADRERMAVTAAANSANDKNEKRAAKENAENGKRARDDAGNDDSPRKKSKVEEAS
jgi:ribonuclease P/MRP protein subunit POP1